MHSSSEPRTTLRAFEGLATTYDRHRPSYPQAIFTALLDGMPRPPIVADIGCGTGISARALADCGARVIAIDPGADMLREARAASAQYELIEFVEGTAEGTGLGDKSVDVALAAQAFHWFEPDAALFEFYRIVRPGGRVALLWNLRIADGGFTDEYNRIVVSASERLDPSTRWAREALDAPLLESRLFVDAKVVTLPSPQTLDEEGVVGRATSASYFPREEPERSERLAELRDAFRRFAIDGVVTLAQEARLTMATRP
ncbi:MAG: class I SAM-dependent methyltransferase [Phycisphaerales bacterium]